MSRFALFFALIVSSSPLWAVGPQITGVTGASNVRLTGAIRIYAAIPETTREDRCTGDGINTCSTCTNQFLVESGDCADTLCVCATKLVYPTLALQINIKNTSSGNKNVYLAISNNGNYERIGTAAGQPGFVTINWSELCLRATFNNCVRDGTSTNTSGLLNVALFYDTDGLGSYTPGEEKTDFTIQFLAPSANDAKDTDYGINSFIPFPGDEKIYITEPSSSSSFPSLKHGGTAVTTRVFLSTSMATASPISGLEPKDLTVSTAEGEFTSNIVNGVNNGTWYYVRLAQMDEAGNITNYYPDLLNPDGCATPQTCPYAVKPDEVLGLLSKDMNCFIATAAYGSAWEPKLKVFRDFRYKVLLRHPWGVDFVKAYYSYGPYAARYIADKPWLRAITRFTLWPAYAFSYMALKLGFASAFGAFFLSICAFLFAINRVTSRRTLKRG